MNKKSDYWELLKVSIENEKLFFFPNLSACPAGSVSDGATACACTATDATTDGTAACKCAANFQFNADETACVGKSHRIITSRRLYSHD